MTAHTCRPDHPGILADDCDRCAEQAQGPMLLHLDPTKMAALWAKMIYVEHGDGEQRRICRHCGAEAEPGRVLGACAGEPGREGLVGAHSFVDVRRDYETWAEKTAARTLYYTALWLERYLGANPWRPLAEIQRDVGGPLGGLAPLLELAGRLDDAIADETGRGER